MKRILSFALCIAMCISITTAYTSLTGNAAAPALAESSKLILDNESGYISRISVGTTKAELLGEFTDSTGISVKNGDIVSDSLLKQSGAAGVIKKGNGIQVVYGPQVAVIKSELEDYLNTL